LSEIAWLFVFSDGRLCPDKTPNVPHPMVTADQPMLALAGAPSHAVHRSMIADVSFATREHPAEALETWKQRH
jgi:hypothetical protein